MKLPGLNRIRKSVTRISIFRGLNKTVNTGFSAVASNNSSVFIEFKKIKNLGSDKFPQLAPRKPRGYVEFESGIKSNVLIASGELIYIDSEGYFNHGDYRAQVQGINGNAAHDLVLYGNRVVVFPEKLAITLNAAHDVMSLESELRNFHHFVIRPVPNGGSYSNANFCKAFLTTEGVFLTPKDFARSETPNVASVDVGELAEAYKESPSVVYRKTESGKEVVQCNYFAIRKAASDKTLKAGDYVKLTIDFDRLVEYGDPQILVDTHIDPAYATYTTLDCIFGNNSSNYAEDIAALQEMDGKNYKVEYVSKTHVFLRGEIERSLYILDGVIKLEKVVPEHDSGLMIEVNNRLWTCSSASNEIYACKLGDCTSWHSYADGISTDSYVATVGCEGEFTAIARQNDSVIFFKENWILKLYGNKPSNFTLATYNVPGVEKGSGKSVVWINGVLYYLSPKGVCQYSPGAQPVVISEGAFGEQKYKNGVAGRHRDKYYLSAENEDGGRELFVFDSRKGVWHKEDELKVDSCMNYNDILYMLDEEDGLLISPEDSDTLIENMTGYEKEGSFEWSCETGDMYDSNFNSKYISRLVFGVRAENDVRIRVLAQFEDGGAWRELGVLLYDEKKPREIPLAVRRSEFLRLRLEGEGQCEIYGIDIEYSQGSVVR